MFVILFFREIVIFKNVAITLPNLVKFDNENDSIISMLSNVVYINFEIENVNSTLFDLVNSELDIRNVISTLI